jgi:hypothetical protein
MATEFIRKEIPEKYLRRIKDISDKKPIFKDSHRGSLANYIGYLGMNVFTDWVNRKLAIDYVGLGIEHLRADIIEEYNYDVLVSFGFKGIKYSYKVEVKTKDRNVAPRPSYEVSVPINTYEFQIPDYYFALSLDRNHRDLNTDFSPMNIYLLGFISRVGYDENKYLEKAGLKGNGANFFIDTWNIRMDKLEEANQFPLGMIHV